MGSTMTKEQLQELLRQLGVRFHHNNGEARLQELLEEALEEQGFELKDGMISRVLTEADLEENEGLAEAGFVVGDVVSLGQLQSGDFSGESSQDGEGEQTPEETKDDVDPEPEPQPEKKSSIIVPGEVQAKGVVHAAKGKFVVNRNVMHNGVFYKKGAMVDLKPQDREHFLAKGWLNV